MTARSDEKDQRILEAIAVYRSEHPYPPTLRELATTCNCSVAGIGKRLVKLATAGRIELDKGRHRSIRLVQPEVAKLKT